MPDVLELIFADHRRIRRLIRAVQEAGRRGGPGRPPTSLAVLWCRLAGLIELHFDAEQEICYPALSAPDDQARLADALADHDDVRAALAEASLQEPGGLAWSRAADAALRMTLAHLPGEEQGLLAVFARRSSPELRKELGRQWAAFTVAWQRDLAFPPRGRPARAEPGPRLLAGVLAGSSRPAALVVPGTRPR